MQDNLTDLQRLKWRLHEIIAVPTGIVTSELSRAGEKKVTTQACPECMAPGHDGDAVYCKFCSARLNPDMS